MRLAKVQSCHYTSNRINWIDFLIKFPSASVLYILYPHYIIQCVDCPHPKTFRRQPAYAKCTLHSFISVLPLPCPAESIRHKSHFPRNALRKMSVMQLPCTFRRPFPRPARSRRHCCGATAVNLQPSFCKLSMKVARARATFPVCGAIYGGTFFSDRQNAGCRLVRSGHGSVASGSGRKACGTKWHKRKNITG